MKKSNKKTLKRLILLALCLSVVLSASVLPIAFSNDAGNKSGNGAVLQTFDLRDYSLQADYVPLTVAENGSYASVAPVYAAASEKAFLAASSGTHEGKYGYEDLASMQNGEQYTAVYEQMHDVMRNFYDGDANKVYYNRITKLSYLTTPIALDKIDSANRSEVAAMILQTVLHDYPEFYFVNIPEQSKHLSGSSIYIYIDKKFGNKSDQKYEAPLTIKEKLEAKVKSYTDLVNDNMSDYVKVQTIHDALIADMSYPENYDSDKDWNVDYQGVTGALLGDQIAVCEGYSEAFKMIMDKIGIECLIVTGDSYDSESVPHEWNMIKIDGAWYNLDVTWDDPIGGEPTHQYFCVPDSVLFNQSHVPGSNEKIGVNYLYPLPAVAQEEHPECALKNLYSKGTNITDYGVPAVTGVNFTGAVYTVVGPRAVKVSSFNNVGESVTVPSCIAVRSSKTASISGDVVYAVVGVGDNVMRNSNYAVDASYDKLKTVDFSNNKYLSEIGTSAFAGCTSLESVRFSNALHTVFKTVGARAFEGCAKLAIDSTDWPATTENIGEAAFMSCLISDQGKALDLSGLSLKTVGADAFAYTGLAKISLPNTLTSVTGAAFRLNDALTDFKVAEGGRYSTDLLGILYTDQGTTLVAVPRAKKDLNFLTVSAPVSKIGEYAFYGTNLETVSLGENVLSVGKYAFAEAAKLSHIDLSDNIGTIEEGTFKNCVLLKNVAIPASVETVNKDAFWAANAGTAVTADNLKTVVFLGAAPKTVAETAFDGCTLLHMNYDEKESWDVEYRSTDATWKGFHALYLFSEPETVQKIVNTDLDTSMVKGTMEYKNGVWKTQNSNEAIARITSDDATKGTIFHLSVRIEVTSGVGGLLFYADDDMQNYYRYSLSDADTLELYYHANGVDSLVCSSKLFAPERLPETTLSVIVDEDGNIQCYVNDELYIRAELNEGSRSGNRLGYALYSKGVVLLSELTSRTLGTNALTYRSGTADYDNVEDFIENTDNALRFIHEGRILVDNHEYDGTSFFRARIDLFGAGGIIFAHRENNGVPSYYMIGFDDDGKLKIRYMEGPAGSDLATSTGTYNIDEGIVLIFERNEEKISVSVADAVTGNLLETVSYTDTEDRLKATGYGLFGADNTEITLFDLRFKNDYSKLDENHVNRQGIYFDIDEENKTAVVGHKGSEEDGNSGYVDKNYGSVIIPESVRIGDVFYRVVGVADKAFAGNKNLRSIVLPESITSVGNRAFYGCENLKLATFKGDAPATAGDEIFTGCHPFFRIETTGKNWGISYTNPLWKGFVCINPEDLYYMNYVVLDENKTDLQSIVYEIYPADVANLETEDYMILYDGRNYNGANNGIVTVPVSVVYAGKLYPVRKIRSYAFNGSVLRGIHLPASEVGVTISEIGTGAFKNCENLESINLSVKGMSITTVAAETFQNCSSLSSVILNPSTVAVNRNAFNGCVALRKVGGIEKLSYIYNNAFENCLSLADIVLSDSISLSERAFFGAGLRSVTFKVSGSEEEGYTGIASISKYAFANCASLENIRLPRTLLEIGEGAFSGSGLRSVRFDEGIELNFIRKDAFRACKELEKLTIPASVVNIGESAFFACDALREVYFEGARPDFGPYVFGLYNEETEEFLQNGQVVLYYENEAEGWDSPFVGDIARYADERTARQHYFAMFTDNPYSGVNGVELKHIELAYGSELWRTNDGAFRFISGNGSHIAVVKNHKISENSLLIFEATVKGSANESTDTYGLIFGLRQEENSNSGEMIYAIPYNADTNASIYTGYFFGIDPETGKVVLICNNEGVETELFEASQEIPGYSKDIAYKLSIRYYADKGSIEGYVNGVKMFEHIVDADNLKNAYCAFKASDNNMEFSDASVIELGDVLTYQSSKGKMNVDLERGYATMTKVPASAIVLNDDFLYDGMTIFNFRTMVWYEGELARNGIVFAMGDDGSYYLLVAEVLEEKDVLSLYRRNAGEEELVKLHSQWMPDSFIAGETYELMVSWNAANDIDCYVDGTWVFTYKLQDDEVLEGRGYGLYAANTEIRFSNTIVTVNNKPDTAKLDEYSDLFDNNRNLQGILFELDPETHTAVVVGGYHDGSKTEQYNYMDENGMVFLPSIVKDTEGNLYTVVAVADSAFAGCADLVEVEIPDTVLSIGKSAFAGAVALENIRLPHELTAIEEETFAGAKALKVITLPNTVVTIGKNAFKGCESLTNVNIPVATAEIGEGAFLGCHSITFFTVADNPNFAVREGVLYSKDFTALVSYPLARKENSLTLPTTVTKIVPYAFYGAKNLKTVVLSAGLTEIGESAFGYVGMTNISIPSGVKSIPQEAFIGCENLKTVVMDAGVRKIGSRAFSACTALESVTLPNGLETIGEKAFGSTALKAITLPSTLTEIGAAAFEKAPLEALSIPDSVVTVGKGAFSGCDRLTSISIGSGMTSLDGFVFVNGAEGDVRNFAKNYPALRFFAVSSENEVFAADSAGALYSADGKTLYCIPLAVTVSKYAVRSGVEVIEDGAIGAFMTLDTLYLPASVTACGATAEYRGIIVCHSDLETVLYERETNDLPVVAFEDMKLTGIHCEGPARFDFTVGNEPDYSGLTVYGDYAYTEKEIPKTLSLPIDPADYSISTFDISELGEKTVVIGYQGKSASFLINYAERSPVSLRLTYPDKLTYVVNDKFTTKGLVVAVNYDAGRAETLHEGQYTVSIVEGTKLAAGEQTVTVSYTTEHNTVLTASFTIQVHSREVINTLISDPNQTTYHWGEAFDSTGISMLLIFNTGETQDLIFSRDYKLIMDDGKELVDGYLMKVDETGQIRVKIELIDIDIPETVIPREIILEVEPIVLTQPDPVVLLSQTENKLVVRLPDSFNTDIFNYVFEIYKNGEWEESLDGSFDDLTSGTTYPIRVRIIRDDCIGFIDTEDKSFHENLFFGKELKCSTLKKLQPKTPVKPYYVNEEDTESESKISLTVGIDAANDPNNADHQYKYEFSIGNGWKAADENDQYTFTGLDGLKEYSIYVRYAANTEYDASERSEVLRYTTDRYKAIAAQPSVSSVSTDSIELKSLGADYEYARAEYEIIEGEVVCITQKEAFVWQKETAFAGLLPNTTYAFVARRIQTETNNIFDSEPSKPVLAKTGLVPYEKPSVPEDFVCTVTFGGWTDDLTEVIFSAFDMVIPYEYHLYSVHHEKAEGEDGEEIDKIVYVSIGDWTDELSFAGLTPLTEYAIKIRHAADENGLVSDESLYTTFMTGKSVQANLTAPKLVEKKANSVELKNDYVTSTGAPASMEFAIYADERWQWQDSPLFEGLDPDTTYRFAQRLKADDLHDVYEASVTNPYVELTVKTKSDFSASFDMNQIYLKGDFTYGSTVTVAFPYDMAVRYEWRIDGATDTVYVGNSFRVNEACLQGGAKTVRLKITPTNTETYDGEIDLEFTPKKATRTVNENGQDYSIYMNSYNKEIWASVYEYGSTALTLLVHCDTFDEVGEWREVTSGKTIYDLGDPVDGQTYHVKVRYKGNDFYEEVAENEYVETALTYSVNKYLNANGSTEGKYIYGENLYTKVDYVTYGGEAIDYVVKYYIEEKFHVVATVVYEDKTTEKWADYMEYFPPYYGMKTGVAYSISSPLAYYTSADAHWGTEDTSKVNTATTVKHGEKDGKTIEIPGVITYRYYYQGYYLHVSVDTEYGEYTLSRNLISRRSLPAPETTTILQDTDVTTRYNSFTVDELVMATFTFDDFMKNDCQFLVSKDGINYVVRVSKDGFEYSTDNGISWKAGGKSIPITVNGSEAELVLMNGRVMYKTASMTSWETAPSFRFKIGEEFYQIEQTLNKALYAVLLLKNGEVDPEERKEMTFSSSPTRYAVNGSSYVVYAYYPGLNPACDSSVMVEVARFTMPKLPFEISENDEATLQAFLKGLIPTTSSTIGNETTVNMAEWFNELSALDVFANNKYASVLPGNLPLQFSRNGLTWEDSLSLSGLLPQTSYEIFVRIAETAYTEASNMISMEIKTKKLEMPSVPGKPALSADPVTSDAFGIRQARYVEYSIDGKEWRSVETIGETVLFENLSPNTVYTVYARYKETDTYQESGASEGLKVTTLRLERGDMVPVLENLDGIATATDSSLIFSKKFADANGHESVLEFFVDGISEAWSDRVSGLEPNTAYTVRVRFGQDELYFSGTKEITLGVTTLHHTPKTPTFAPTARVVTDHSITLIAIPFDEEKQYAYEYYCVLGNGKDTVVFDEEKWQDDPQFEDLFEDQEYTFYCRVKADDRNFAGKPGPGATFVTTPMSISGSISIGYVTDGVHAQGITYGAILTVNMDNLTSKPVAPTYQWYRNGIAIKGEVRAQYEVKKEDIGQIIMVHLTGDALCPGDVEAKEEIKKRSQTAPTKLNLTVEGTTIAVQILEGCEYSINNGASWSNFEAEADGYYRLTGYAPETEVTVLVRRSETDTDAASDAISTTVRTTKNAAKAVPLSVKALNSTIEFQMYAGCVYTIVGTNFEVQEFKPETDLYYKHEFTAGGTYIITAKRLATDYDYESELISKTVTLDRGTQEAPTAILEMKSRTDTTITLIAIPGCEYSIDQIAWYTNVTFTNLSPNTEYTFYYRYKETAYREASDIGPTSAFTTDKAKQATPAAPSLVSKTARTIVVGFNRNQEYCIVSAREYDPTAVLENWIGYGDTGEEFILSSSAVTFVGLEPESEYFVFTRAKETNTAYASEASTSLRVVTYAEYGINFYISYYDNDNQLVSEKLEGISRAYYRGEAIDLDSIASMLPAGEKALRYSYSVPEDLHDRWPENAYNSGEYSILLPRAEKIYTIRFEGAHGEELAVFQGGYQSTYDLPSVLAAPEYHPVEGDENFEFTFRAYSDGNGTEYLPSEISDVIVGDVVYTAVYNKARLKYDVAVVYIDNNGDEQTENRKYDAGTSIIEIESDIKESLQISEESILYRSEEGEYKFSAFIITDSVDNTVAKESIIADNLTFIVEYNMQAHRHIVYDTDNAEKGYKPVTCTENGKRGAKCTDCGFEWEEILYHKGHNYKWVAEVPATCTEDGVEAHYECTVCHKTFDGSKTEWNELTIPMLNHAEKKYDAGYEANCTEEGKLAHWYCPDCQKNFEDVDCTIELQSLVIPKEEHIWASEWTDEVPATCTENGVKGHRYCTSCKQNYDADGNVITSLTVEKLGHQYGEWIEKTPATVDAEGEYAHYHCDRCQGNFDEKREPMNNIVIPKCGIISVSTEDAGRGQTVTVTISLSQNPGIASMKIYVNYDAAVFSIETGRSIKNGDILGRLEKGDETRTPLVLTWSGGENSFDNGDLVKITFLVSDTSRFGASTISVLVDETCNEALEWLDMVSESGSVSVHNFSEENWIPEDPASCTKDGIIGHYHCSVCGRNFNANKQAVSDLKIPSPGHIYGEWINEAEAQCVVNGTKGHYECAACHKYFDASKNEIVDLTIPAPGHDYGEWNKEIAAQCEANGVKGHYECAACHKYFDASMNEIDDLTIPTPGHNYGTWIPLQDSSCTKTGTLGHYHCSNCDKDFDAEHGVLSNLTIEKKAHDYGEWIKEDDTNHKKVCSCGDTVREAHQWDDGKTDVVATFYHAGSKIFTCPTCHGTRTETIDMLVREDDSPLIFVSDAHIGVGKTAVLTLSIQNNPGLNTLVFNLICPNGLSIEKVEDAEGREVTYTKGSPITYTAAEDLTEDGILLNVTVKADASMKLGNVTVGMELVGAYNASGAEVAVCVAGCTVEVFRFGDLNGDGDINILDATLMMQQIAEWEGLKINLYAADVVVDGEIDILDATRLMQYIAEWDVELG